MQPEEHSEGDLSMKMKKMAVIKKDEAVPEAVTSSKTSH